MAIDTDQAPVAETQEAPAPEAGQGDVVEATPDTPVEAAPAPAFDEADLLDTSELGDRPVRLTIDGEEQVVPLSDVLKGYNSNAAATQRFQEAAALREQAEQQAREAEQALTLARAVSNDPGMTMRVLAQQAGLSVEQFLNLTPAQQESVAAAQAPEPEFNDPLERAIYEERQARMQLEQRIAAQEEQRQREQADNSIRSALGSLQSQFGATDEDVQAVVRQAFEMRVGPELFPMIYQSQQFQKGQVVAQTQAEVNAARAAEDAQRQQAAAAASGTVTTGTGAVGTAPQQVVQPMTAEEAVRQTLDQLGWPD